MKAWCTGTLFLPFAPPGANPVCAVAVARRPPPQKDHAGSWWNQRGGNFEFPVEVLGFARSRHIFHQVVAKG